MGTIRTHESTRKLARRLAQGMARVLSATVRHERGRWFVSFPGQVKREPRRVARPGVALGIDLGVQHLAVMADSAGEIRYVSNPKHYDTPGDGPAASVPACVSRRRGPDKRTGQKPSTRWCNANAERDRVHHRVANLRADALPKLTTAVREEYGTVVVEDLRRRRDAAQPAPRPHDF